MLTKIKNQINSLKIWIYDQYQRDSFLIIKKLDLKIGKINIQKSKLSKKDERLLLFDS